MAYSYRSNKPSYGSPRGGRPNSGGQRRQNRPSRGPAGEYINPSRFVKAATVTETEAYEPKHTFADFALNDLLMTNLAKKGYTVPSPIQDQAIPVAMSGRDVIGIASTGTGKTAAFALPLLQRLMTTPQTAALIIAPTRELANQIESECRDLALGSGLGSVLLIGGVGMGNQLRTLQRRPRIVIGTPGRIKDHLQRGSLKLGHFNTIVLDEVDRMLDMGFVNDVTAILRQTSQTRQALFFSATLDARVRKLIENFTSDPVLISLDTGSASENVHQDVIRFDGTNDKLDKLHELLIKPETSKVIVFDETQRSVERLSKELVTRGFSAGSIHGGKSQGQRQRALASFKNNEISVLVATDVAARGIDVADISHVVNYSLPKAYDDYIHRIGRAGRAGKVGHALTFVAK